MTFKHPVSFWPAAVVALMLFLLPGFRASAQGDVGPKMVLQEPSHDREEVKEGQFIERNYDVLNRGDQPLEIKQVAAGCGCTVTSFDRIIPPGGKGKIQIRVDTKGILGPLRENVRVYTNDPGRPQVILVVKAEVKPVITLSRRFVNFYGKEGERIVKEVEITAETEKPLMLKPIQFSLDGKLTYTLEKIQEGKKYKVRIENIPGPAENFRGFLKLRTNYPEKPEVTIWIWAQIAKKNS